MSHQWKQLLVISSKTRSCWRSRSPIPAMPTRAAPRSSTTSGWNFWRQRAADRLGRLSVPRLCRPAGGRFDPHPRQLVSEGALFQFAQEIDLGEYLRLGRGEERCGGRNRPSVVSDAFEALIAALYLDGGMDVARSFILPLSPRASTPRLTIRPACRRSCSRTRKSG